MILFYLLIFTFQLQQNKRRQLEIVSFEVSHGVPLPQKDKKMPYSFKVEGAEKNDLVLSLAALLLSDCSVEITEENLTSVVSSSNNSVPAYMTTLYANLIAKAGGVSKFQPGPSAGGGKVIMIIAAHENI